MLQFVLNGLSAGSVIAVVALGFGLIFLTSRVFHLAHGGIMVVAGYTFWAAMSKAGLPVPVAAAVAVVSGATLGVLVNLLVYEPLIQRESPSALLLISSLGAAIIIENSVALTYGAQGRFIDMAANQPLLFGELRLTGVQLVQVATAAISTLGLWLLLRYTGIGQACRAVSDDPQLAAALGIRERRVRGFAFALGSALAAIGAVLVVIDGGIEPHMGFPFVLGAAVACIVAGQRSFLAPALGGILLGLLQSVSVSMIETKWQTAVVFTILLLFLVFRPQGILGQQTREDQA